MTESTGSGWYPEFRDGQVISAEELNRLGAHLREQARFRSRLMDGFGILYGLEGRIVAEQDEWELGPGAAIDALGRGVVVDEPLRIGLSTLSEGIVRRGRHPAIGPVEGFPQQSVTPVLVYRASHAMGGAAEIGPDLAGARVRDTCRIVLVPGRLRSPPTPPLCEVRPLRLPVGLRVRDGIGLAVAFHELRDRLHLALDETDLSRTAHHCLQRASLSGRDESGLLSPADLLMVAALNDVVYSGWQYARAGEFLALHGDYRFDASADGEQEVAGLPLGWLYKHRRKNWQWDSRWRAGYAVGVTLLEHVVGYSPKMIQAMCLKRIARVLDIVTHLKPSLPPRSYEAQHLACDAWTLTPHDYRAGTSSWLRGTEWDRACKWSCFWPLDPLRGSLEPPGAVEPLDDEFDRPAPPDLSRRRSPSLLDPVNDPYSACTYANAEACDPRHVGLIALAELIGHPLDQVEAKLHQLYSGAGLRSVPLGAPIPDTASDAMGGLQYCMTVSLTTRLHALFAASTRQVIGFACPTLETELADALPPIEAGRDPQPAGDAEPEIERPSFWWRLSSRWMR